MRVFIAGATGAVGKALVPRLVAAGHEVVGMTRSPEGASALRALGSDSIVADALDKASVMEGVLRAKPETIVHQMTALGGLTSFKRFDDGFALTNRLRTEGLDHLLKAARAAGSRRVIAQSYGNWNYERVGGRVKDEEDPFDPDPPRAMRKTLDAIRHLELAVLEAAGIEGLALRYGNLYGSGTGFSENGALVELVRRRRLPIIGDGAGVWSFVHVDDVATATMAAIERGAPGAYNVVDDDPAAVHDWLPELAKAIGAKPPWRIPVWLGRLAAGEAGVSMFTSIRGASNDKAKHDLGWQLIYPSWREGFRSGLGETMTR